MARSRGQEGGSPRCSKGARTAISNQGCREASRVPEMCAVGRGMAGFCGGEFADMEVIGICRGRGHMRSVVGALRSNRTGGTVTTGFRAVPTGPSGGQKTRLEGLTPVGRRPRVAFNRISGLRVRGQQALEWESGHFSGKNQRR